MLFLVFKGLRYSQSEWTELYLHFSNVFKARC